MEGDQPTIVIQEPPKIVEVPAAPTVNETLGAAAVVVDMANALAEVSAPVDRTGEMIALLSEIRDDMRAMRNSPPVTPEVVVIEPEPEPEVETPVVNEPEIIVNTGELKKEEVSEVIPTDEPPKKRKRNWL